MKWWMMWAGENIRKTICYHLGSLEADTEIEFEVQSVYGMNACEGKAEQAGLGRGRSWSMTRADKASANPAGSLQAVFPMTASWIRLKWIFQRFVEWSSGVGRLNLGLSGSLQLRLTLKLLRPGDCLLITLPTSRHQVLTWREKWLVHLHIYHTISYMKKSINKTP